MASSKKCYRNGFRFLPHAVETSAALGEQTKFYEQDLARRQSDCHLKVGSLFSGA